MSGDELLRAATSCQERDIPYGGGLSFDYGRIDTLTQVIQGDTTVLAYGYDEIGRIETVETNGALTAAYT